jgi:uncharacterized protein (DUF58 family)
VTAAAAKAPPAGIVASRDELVALGYERLKAPRRRAARVSTPEAGGRASRFRGRGMEFSEVRAYQPGDDVRSIDWRVTARTGRPHSKLFEEERERPVWLLVDLGASMRFGTRAAFKSVAAARAAAVLAWEAHREGERVGASVAAPGETTLLPPGRTRRQLLHLLGVVAAGTAVTGDAPSEPLEAQLQRLAPRLRAGSRVALVSDFYAYGEALAASLRGVAQRCDVTLVHVFDPIESTPPPAGRYRVSDGREVRTVASGRAGEWQRMIAREFEVRGRALQELAGRYRMQLVPLRTDEPPARSLSTARGPVARIGAA